MRPNKGLLPEAFNVHDVTSAVSVALCKPLLRFGDRRTQQTWREHHDGTPGIRHRHSAAIVNTDSNRKDVVIVHRNTPRNARSK